MRAKKAKAISSRISMTIFQVITGTAMTATGEIAMTATGEIVITAILVIRMKQYEILKKKQRRKAKMSGKMNLLTRSKETTSKNQSSKTQSENTQKIMPTNFLNGFGESGRYEKKSNILDVEVKNYREDECGYCKDDDTAETLSVAWDLWCTWQMISLRMGNKEWTGVLRIKDSIIEDFKIPEQIVTSTSCDLKEELGGNGLVHSHHTMGAFHSGQDDKHARNLFEYSIVLSGSDYVATRKVTLPCGAFGYKKVTLLIINEPAIDMSKIKEEAKASPMYLYEDEYIDKSISGKGIAVDTTTCDFCGEFDDKLTHIDTDGEHLNVCERCRIYLEQYGL
jgi:hypothetical protein